MTTGRMYLWALAAWLFMVVVLARISYAILGI